MEVFFENRRTINVVHEVIYVLCIFRKAITGNRLASGSANKFIWTESIHRHRVYINVHTDTNTHVDWSLRFSQCGYKHIHPVWWEPSYLHILLPICRYHRLYTVLIIRSTNWWESSQRIHISKYLTLCCRNVHHLPLYHCFAPYCS